MQSQTNPSLVTLESAVPRASGIADTADRVGAAGSLLCAVHCATMPLILSALPALGLGFLASVDLDQAFVVFATLLGVTTLTLGFRRHRAHHAWALLVPGLLLLWAGSFTHLHDHTVGHALMMGAGGLLIAAAHVLNLRLSHRLAATSTSRLSGVESA